MKMKTRIAILGYGNLGRGAEAAIAQNPDMALVCVLTRRDPAGLTLRTPAIFTAFGFEGINYGVFLQSVFDFDIELPALEFNIRITALKVNI